MTSTDRVVRVKAPGKINLYLGVGALQEDGYHEVATAYQAVSLYEFVEVREASDFQVEFAGPIDSSGLPTDGTNLAIRAAMMLARKAKIRSGVHIRVEKHVPIAGGMGGGSADAAATLLACEELWQTGISKEEIYALGAKLGADVPFALHGGTALGTGRGDSLSPVLATGEFHWVLALQDGGLSTPQVYKALDEHRARYAADISPALPRPDVDHSVLQALRQGDAMMLAEYMHNDLQAPALGMLPELAALLELGEQNGALRGIVSGSGPTCAFLCADNESALSLQITLSAAGISARKVTAPAGGARTIDS
ncbi:4-(cytidine 5'-diphospho)-2-C-methyl-D-erythritol kinase [Humidisolicoccus flavus]|uniref:4-(cytidine 5'-diphospho)-2-C-methyl-D-erythritol kinase n=1 Tax=Humidisolicoccus flavus TaxID=3111414 RepID=UPI003254662E